MQDRLTFRFTCPGCVAMRKTTLPRKDAPFGWTCKTEGCGWTMEVVGNDDGFAVAWHRPAVTLRLVRPAPDSLETDGD